MVRNYLVCASLVLSILSCQAQKEVNSGTADMNATQETINLLKNMKALTSKGIMFGHQDDLVYGRGWKYVEGQSDVRRVCGDYPAVYGWELGHIELKQSVSLDSVPFDIIRHYITEVHKRGGVNTISWHMDNPLTGGTAWDNSSNGALNCLSIP